MSGILTQAHMQRLERLRQINIRAGEPETILLEKLDPSTREYVALVTIDKSFYPFFNLDAEGKSLPLDVRYELQIGEEMLTAAQARQVAAVKFGNSRYRVVRGDQAEPGVVRPTGNARFYRFHLAPLEEVT